MVLLHIKKSFEVPLSCISVKLEFTLSIQYVCEGSERSSLKLLQKNLMTVSSISIRFAGLLQDSSLYNKRFYKVSRIITLLTIIAGFSQTFQWGSAWQNMVLAAQRLQAEFDRFLTTPMELRNHRDELELLNEFVVGESETFFERMLGGARLVSESRQLEKQDIQELSHKV